MIMRIFTLTLTLLATMWLGTTLQAQCEVTFTVVNTNCSQPNGSIDVTASGGTEPYTYDWADLAGANDPEDRTGLGIGTYALTVTDALGCVVSVSPVVAQVPPPVAQMIAPSVIPCAPPSILLTALPATGVTYAWSSAPVPVPGTNTATVSSAGTYTVTVTAISTGCTATATASATQASQPSVTTVATPSSCFGTNTGTIDVTASGGTAPYTYDWADLSGTNNIEDRMGLTPGTYVVTVRDANGCTSTASAIVTTIPSPIIQSNVTPSACGQATGSITWTVQNGPTPAPFTNLAPGVYTVTVTNANGCTATRSATVPSVGPTLTYNVTNASCTEPVGAIAITVSGSTGPYTYDWADLPGTNEPPIRDTLLGGTYLLTVTDAFGCTVTASIPVYPLFPVIISAAICENSIDIETTNYTPFYTYDWADILGSSNTSDRNNLSPGAYTITITAPTGCSAARTFNITPNPNPCTTIEGRIIIDANENCTADATENGLGNWLVRATGNGQTFYGLSDSTGAYQIRVAPNVAYSLSLVPLPDNSNLCDPTPVTGVIAEGSSEQVDLLLQNLVSCPQMSVELSTPLLRRCFSDNYYTLAWCNQSAFTITDGYILLQLDPALSIVNAQLPYTNVGPNTWRFDLGTVDPFECGQFFVWVTVSCNTTLGQTHCSTASIFPHGPCDTWLGAELRVEAQCTGDSLHFLIKNVGLGDMSTALEYIVIEDGIMTMSQSGLPPLASNQTFDVSLPANGSTWRVEADQEPTFPGESLPVLSVEGCTTTGQFSTGWVQPFTQGAQDDWESTSCEPNVGSYDPNDKQGLPLGYGPAHYVEPRTRLDYRIRFQNTGTDTAFAVVIRDTLAPWFDISSLRLGGSSHPYQFEFGGENVLVFDFQGIMLPDSNTNLEASQGFVWFSIALDDATPLETDVLNSAAIYFDFNPPIITNTTQHRVGINFLTVGLWEPVQPAYAVRVEPQPMSQSARIALVGLPAGEQTGQFRLRVFDLQGRTARELQSTSPFFDLKKEQLTSGVYPFSIERNGQVLGSGRLVVRE
jgi:hypothetical protein